MNEWMTSYLHFATCLHGLHLYLEFHMLHIRALNDNSDYTIRPTNSHMSIVFITCNSLPTCFSGNLQDYNESKKMSGSLTHFNSWFGLLVNLYIILKMTAKAVETCRQWITDDKYNSRTLICRFYCVDWITFTLNLWSCNKQFCTSLQNISTTGCLLDNKVLKNVMLVWPCIVDTII